LGTTRFDFTPREAPKPAEDDAHADRARARDAAFRAMFTKNAFPGAPIIVGRKRLKETDARCDPREQQNLERLRTGWRGGERAGVRGDRQLLGLNATQVGRVQPA